MAAKIKQALSIEPEIIPGERGVFDVRVNDECVYSKTETGTFPDEEKLLDSIMQTYGDGSPQ